MQKTHPSNMYNNVDYFNYYAEQLWEADISVISIL